MTIEEVFTNTDWVQLRVQKNALCDCLQDAYATRATDGEAAEGDRAELIEGLLCFLDAVQDCAADTYGYEVFTAEEVTQ